MNRDEIRRLRVRLGWSQERMARELGVSWAAVSRWERGKTMPRGLSILALDRLAHATEAASDPTIAELPTAV